jgi:hypothetical protein
VRGKQARMRDPPRPAAVNLPKPSGPAGSPLMQPPRWIKRTVMNYLIGHGKSRIGAQPDVSTIRASSGRTNATAPGGKRFAWLHRDLGKA